MKPIHLLVPVAALALLNFYPSAASALVIPTFDPGNNAPMPAALVQLYTDLAAIPVGSAATNAQHQALVADLNALAAGIFTPDPAAVDQLATDLGTAATNDLFSDNVVEYLADDFIGDVDDPASWMDDIQSDVASLIDPQSNIYEIGDPTGLPVETGVAVAPLGSVYGGVINGSFDRFVVQLTAQGLPADSLGNYSGRVRLTVSNFLGIAPLPTLTLNTTGLPLSNPYTVSITRQSDGASVVLGKFRVHGALLRQPALSTQAVTSSHVTFGGFNTKKPLPADYDAADVATLTVTDSQGVVRLSGNVADGARVKEVKTKILHLTGTLAVHARTAYARVKVQHRATAALTSDRFRFLARHLPINSPVTLLADGVVVDHYVTTAHGRLFIVGGFKPQKLNRFGVSPPFNELRPGTDLSDVKTLTLTDAQGNVLLTGRAMD